MVNGGFAVKRPGSAGRRAAREAAQYVGQLSTQAFVYGTSCPYRDSARAMVQEL